MSPKNHFHAIRFFSMVVIAYAGYRLLKIIPDIVIFGQHPFFLDFLSSKIMEPAEFYRMLIYLNLNFFLIIVTSLAYLALGINCWAEKKWAVRWILFVSVFGCFYHLLERIVFFEFTMMDITDIFVGGNTLRKILGILYFLRHFVFYVWSIAFAVQLTRGKELKLRGIDKGSS